MRSCFKKPQVFLLDMDGTFYLDDDLLPGAKELLDWLQKTQTRFLFLTNNSSRSKREYQQKLKKMGLDLPKENFFTSGEATIWYLKKHYPNSSIRLYGTPALEQEFLQAGLSVSSPILSISSIQSISPVIVLGFDTTLTYNKLCQLCDDVRAGLPYICTHPDINCPTKTGFVPDIGSFIEAIAASTGRRPDLIVGKPHQPIVDALVELTGVLAAEMCMIGDRLYTDVAMGQTGMTTVLTLTGETRKKDLVGTTFRPTLVVRDLVELLEVFS